MSDLIKREDVIAVIKRCKDRLQGKGLTYEIMLDMVERIPSADRPQGEWIETSEGTMCGNCHKYPYDDGEYHIANWHSDFCPNCGCRMKGADDE